MNIKLEAFEGPFELLFHLIEKNKIDIKDIPIAFIADSFIEHIEKMEKKSMAYISDFIVMAATLLEIKSKMLLPVKEINKDGEEIDPRDELVEKLIEYKKAKSIANELNQKDTFLTFSREPEKSVISNINSNSILDIDKYLHDTTLKQLNCIFQNVLLRSSNKLDYVRKDFDSVQKDEFTIENRTEYILKRLYSVKSLSFLSLFNDYSTRSEKVTTFLAVLELIKVNEICITQNKVFDDIVIRRAH